MKIRLLYALFLLFVVGCSSNDSNVKTTASNYSIVDGDILKNGNVLIANGVNTLNTFGIANHELYSTWNINIVREFIGNLREQPISGFTIKDSQGSFLHPLQKVVDANRSQNVVTILCPFGWVDESGNQTLFTGLNPSDQEFYKVYKLKMKAIAEQFKNQPDVWIEVWNEPYHFDNANGYSHELWLRDQTDMVRNLRSVNGFNNVIIVPGNEQGQSETVILEKGAALLANNNNIIFDLHAYEKWIINMTETAVKNRINGLKNGKIPIIFGEVGVINSNDLMTVDTFLAAVKTTQTPTIAWLFNRNTNDQNSLLTDDGEENNTNNNKWGTTFKQFLNN